MRRTRDPAHEPVYGRGPVLIAIVVWAAVMGCVRVPPPAPPTAAERVAQARRAFLASDAALDTRLRCLEVVVGELGPTEALEAVSGLLALSENRDRTSARQELDPLTLHAALILHPRLGPTELPDVQRRFAASASTRVRILCWTLLLAAAQRGELVPDIALALQVLGESQDPLLVRLVLEGIGACHAPETAIEYVARQVLTAPPGPEQHYPGLGRASWVWVSVLSSEDLARQVLAVDVPPEHPLRRRFGEAGGVSDSTPLVVSQVLRVAADSQLRQLDVYTVASFLARWSPASLPRLADLDVVYDDPDARRELRTWLRIGE